MAGSREHGDDSCHQGQERMNMGIVKTAAIAGAAACWVVLALGASGACGQESVLPNFPEAPRATAAAGAGEKESGIHVEGNQRVGFNWYMTDGAGSRWDISSNGQVSDGTNDAYDGGMQLRMGQTYFSGTEGKLAKSGREVEIGPWTNGSVRVWRRVYIDAAVGYARWIDIYENTANTAADLKVQYYSNLGGTISATTTTTGKQDLTDKDWGIVTSDSTDSQRPAIVHIFANKGSRARPEVKFTRNTDEIFTNFAIKIPPGKTVAICQFEAQRGGNDQAVKFLKDFNPRRELDKVPADLRKLIVNMGGATLVMGNIDLPRNDKFDLAIRRNETEDELLGTIINERFDVETFYGKLELPAAKVAGLSIPAADDPYVQVVLLDGQMVAGKLLNAPLRLRLTNGNEMSLPPEKLLAATFALSPQRPAEIKISRPTLILRSGQQLAFRAGDLDLRYQTLHGEVRLEADQLARLELDTPDGGLHRAIFRNGSVLSGLLVAESLKLDLDLGPVLETRRQVASQVLLPAEDIDASGLCEMTLRNEDVLFGQIADESLAVDTQYGKVTVSPSDIDELTVPQEAALGQVSIKLRGGTTVTGKFVSQTIGFQVEPGPKLPVFMGNIVHIKCPPPGKAAGESKTPAKPASGSAAPTPPDPSGGAAALEAHKAETAARAAEEAKAQAETAARQAADEQAKKDAAKVRAAAAADEAAAAVEKKKAEEAAAESAAKDNVHDQQAAEAADRAAQLKQLSAQLKAVQAQQDKLAAEARELAKKENSKDALEKNAKAQAELAKNAEELRKQIAAIQQSMLRSTTSQPK
jgi:hypothetical protein